VVSSDTAVGLGWVAAGVLGALVEVLSLQVVAGLLGVGCLAAAASAFLGCSPIVQVAVFAVSSVLLLLAVRPPVRRWMASSVPAFATNTAALAGRAARVVRPVSDRGGQVRLAGEVWTARTEGPTAGVLELGSPVQVVRIDGATAIVRPFPPEQSPEPGGPVDLGREP
jgi:membrane protein implicated in regulation of membrane protease activity